MLLVLLMYALFGSVFTISKVALEHTSPLFLVGSRMVVAGILLIGYQVSRDYKNFSISSLPWTKLLLLAISNIYLTNALEYWALQYLTSFKSCLIYSLSPLISVLLAYWMLGETMTSKKWLGLGISFIGFFPILLSSTPAEMETGHILFFSWAECAMMLAATCSVFGWIVMKQVVQGGAMTAVLANGVSMFIGGMMALSHSAIVESWDPLPVTNFEVFIDCTLLLIIISNLICYNLYGNLLKRYSATFLSLAGFTTPIFAAIFGSFFLGEEVTMAFILSLGMIFGGLLLYHQDEFAVTATAEQG